MSGKLKFDLTGKEFGRFIVLSYHEGFKPGGKVPSSYWVCLCSCGEIRVVRSISLRRGTSGSCGCLNRDICSEKFSGKGNPMYGVSGSSAPRWGKKHLKSTKRKISLAVSGSNHPLFGVKGKEHPMYGTHRTLEVRRKMSIARRGKYVGPNSPSWKGGVSKKNKKTRRGLRYKIWREQVFKRDNYICQKCKIKGGDLRAHHIFSFSRYPEKQFDISNGVTFCEEDHILFHRIFGKKEFFPVDTERFLEGKGE